MSSVLIIDDDRSIRTGLAFLAEAHGHAPATAATVEEGMDKLAARPTHLLLDLNLPDGPGTDILRHVRAAGLPVRVAVVSGSGDPRLLAEVDALGPDAVFLKPPDLDALMAWIARP